MPKKEIDLLRDDPKRLFGRYLLPSVSATFVTSIYIIVDTIMIGRGVGAEALVALNLVLPVFSLLFACGMLLGVGGGVLMSVAHGADDEPRAKAVFSTALAAAVALAVVLTVAGSVLLTPLSTLLGADDTNRTMVLAYGAYVVHFAPIFLFSTFLQAFVRNDRDPKRAMVGVLSGAAANIVLDYVFIFPMGMGMAGGAAATVIGNALTVVILLTHFASKRNTMRFSRRAISWSALRQIVPCGASSFLIEGAQGIVTFSFNRQLLRYLGTGAVVIYGIIANCAIVCMSLFNGVSQAAQPVLAANYGARLPERVRVVRRFGTCVVLGLGVVLASTAYWMPQVLIGLFVEPTAALYASGTPILRLYFLAFVPMGLNLFLSTYFQSIVRPAQSFAVTVLRGVVLPLALVLALPAVFGAGAIWFTVPATELLTLALGLALLRRRGKTA